MTRSILAAAAVVLIAASSVPGASGVPLPPGALGPAVDALRHGACGAAQAGPLEQAAREPTPAGARAAFLRGHCFAVMGRSEAARLAFLDVVQRGGPLAAHARLGAARVALAAGDVAASAEISAPPVGASSASQARLLLINAEALLRTGQAGRAAAAARRVVAGDRPDAVLVEGWWLLGQASSAAGDVDAARSAYAMAWWAFPGGARGMEASRRLRALSAGRDPVPTPRARAERGLRLVTLWDFEGAERELALAVKGPLPERVAAAAWYELGLRRLGTRQAVNALQEASRYTAERDRTLFWLGLAWLRIGAVAEAHATWARLRTEYPDSLWSARAIYTLGRGAEAGARWAQADRQYALLIDRYPRSPRADDARWRRAWMRHRQGRTAESTALFSRYATAWPQAPRAAAHLYWAWRTSGGPARSASTALREVAERYPLTFYGQRARARLGLTVPPGPPAAEAETLAADRFHPVHEELAALGFERAALEELHGRLGDDASPEVRTAAAELYARLGELTASVTVLEPLVDAALYGRRPLDRAVWRLAYPRAFWPQVVREASRHDIDPLLVLAVIREESRFDARAVSTANAIGLMQLLPSTARGVLGRPAGPALLKDPAVNIRAGTAYLAGLLRGYQGTVPLAVGAYNAGPGGVRRHAVLARSDLDRFVEELPYAETRAYVQRVMQTYGIYRWLYR